MEVPVAKGWADLRPESIAGSADPLKRPKGVEPSGLMEAARSFEAYFLYTLLREMRKTLPQGEGAAAASGKGIYDAMMDEALSRALAERGSIGLSRLLIDRYGGRPEAAGTSEGTERLKFAIEPTDNRIEAADQPKGGEREHP